MPGELASGKQVGQYLFLSRIGNGAFGSVYAAINTAMECSPTFAIKRVRESDDMQRWRQQIAEIVNLDAVADCPYVMRLCDLLREDGYLYLVFPMCEMDMDRAIWQQNVYWKKDALIRKTFLDILNGVHACHKKGVYHRDLKPGNIMCNAGGMDIMISDFGLSTDRRLSQDGRCGTSCYMCPESLDEATVTYDSRAADIWSLGMILFNMVTGRFPWDEARIGDKEFMAFLTDEDYLFRTSIVSGPLSMLLDRIWHPNPSLRLRIPEIRKAVLHMDTFYKPDRRSTCGVFPLSKEISLPVKGNGNSQQTCVAPVEGDELEGKDVRAAHARDVFEEIPLSRLNLKAKSQG